jgi:hypothetical protein
LRKVLVVTLTTAVGVALVSCSETRQPLDRSSASSTRAYENAGVVVRAPLAPPADYSRPLPLTDSPLPLAPHVNFHEPQTTGLGSWRASPRWADIRGKGCIEVETDPGVEAGHVRVENCPGDDVGAADPPGEALGLPPE